MKIEIVSRQHLKPSCETPTQLRDFKLSFIDERIPPSYTPLILYYTFSEDESILQLQMCDRLKTSLSDALVQYYPLAGRMKGHVFIDCNDEGIVYVEANSDGNISDIIKSPESAVLDKLIPFVANGIVNTADHEQLALQITRFKSGGIAIGICMSHRIADGWSLSSFIKCWAANAMHAAAHHHHTNVAPPLFNSSTLFPPRNTPDFRPNLASLSLQPLPAVNIVTKRFIFTPSALNALKLLVTEVVKPTRVEVLTAFLWSRCAAAKGVKNTNKYSVAYHPVNLRGKTPSLTESSFGNIFQMVSVESSEETEWVKLVEKLRAAFGEVDSEYVKKLFGERGFEIAKENFIGISKYLARGNFEVFRFSSFCRFPIYEADFGWGKPALVSSGGYRNKDSIFLFDSVEWRGGIEAWIVMSEDDMGRLQQDMDLHHFTSDFLHFDFDE